MKRIVPVIAVIFLGLIAVFALWPGPSPRSELRIVAGSENQALEPLIQDWARQNGVTVEITYQGSVEISRALGEGKASAFDAVWPAHSLWIALGDTQKVVRNATSILRSPVVLGLKKPIAEKLGWVGRKDITIQMIEEAARSGRFRLAMTSATQSNSGASAYFGFLYALAGNPDILTLDTLAEPKLQDDMRGLLSLVNRSSGSSGWLKDSLVENPDAYDAMMNYESVVIEANEALTAKGQPPLYIIYPANGMAVADSPLGLIDKGDAGKEKAFNDLQAFLLSPDTQSKLAGMGRRTGLIGLDATGADPKVWNPDWGIDLARDIAPIPTPASDVIAEALALYQSDLRKPSLTVWVLDVSGSMDGGPINNLKTAMGLLLDPASAAVNLLQPSRRDVTIIIPFNHEPQAPTVVQGSTPGDLSAALTRVNALEAGGGTDIYAALGAAFAALEPYATADTLHDYLPAIVVMTDGASDAANKDWLIRQIGASGFARDVPIHSIAFGDADETQLQELSHLTIGRMFKAGDDIGRALRGAKGYN